MFPIMYVYFNMSSSTGLCKSNTNVNSEDDMFRMKVELAGEVFMTQESNDFTYLNAKAEEIVAKHPTVMVEILQTGEVVAFSVGERVGDKYDTNS